MDNVTPVTGSSDSSTKTKTIYFFFKYDWIEMNQKNWKLPVLITNKIVGRYFMVLPVPLDKVNFSCWIHQNRLINKTCRCGWSLDSKIICDCQHGRSFGGKNFSQLSTWRRSFSSNALSDCQKGGGFESLVSLRPWLDRLLPLLMEFLRRVVEKGRVNVDLPILLKTPMKEVETSQVESSLI